MTLKIKIALVLAALVLTLNAQTQIYRSMQGNKTAALATAGIGSLTISGTTATFSGALPDTIGVGDVINYNATLSIAFIHGRTSSTVYTVRTATGGTPTAIVADVGWNIYRAYTTIGSWESGTENTGIPIGVRNFDTGNRNLVSNNEQWHVACYRGTNPGEDGFVLIAGWTTDDATGNYVRIYAPYSFTEVGVTQRHSGVEVSPFPYMRLNSGISFSDAGTDIKLAFRFEGLVSIMTSISCQNFNIVDGLAGSVVSFEDCIFYGRNGSACNVTTGGVTALTDYNGTIKIKNCIFYNFDGSGNNSGAGSHAAMYFSNTATGSFYINNVTDYNSNYSIRVSDPDATVVVKNTVSQASDTFGFFTEAGGAYHAGSNYNLSDRAADAPGANSKNSTTVTFVSVGSNNYHLDPTDTGAGNSGTDLSGDANLPVTTDIDRDARPTSYVDMGADEGVASPASSSTSQSKRKYFLRRNR